MKKNFWIWNNGRAVLNLNSIRTINVVEHAENEFAIIVFNVYGTLSISREMYDSLMNTVLENQ